MDCSAEASEAINKLNQEIISCKLCPRLVWYREYSAINRPRRYIREEYWAKPITGFGDINARILVIGLAPAAHGGNRTGRIFTGDSSGNTLMKALYEVGLSNKPNSINRDDGLQLRDVYLTAVVRCVPPENKPSREEIANCTRYLVHELQLLKNTRVVITLGRIAFDTFLRVAKAQQIKPQRVRKLEFKHGRLYRFAGVFFGRKPPVLIASYHPSRQNTQTGRLTHAMLVQVFRKALKTVEENNKQDNNPEK